MVWSLNFLSEIFCVLFKVVRQEHTMSTVLKHVIIVRIKKLVTLIPGNVMIMGVRFMGLNRLCVVISYLNQVIYWVCNNLFNSNSKRQCSTLHIISIYFCSNSLLEVKL